jgi:hypothetical protein
MLVMEESADKDNRMEEEMKINGGGTPPTEQLGARMQQILAQEREKGSRTMSSASESSAASVGVESNFHGDSTYSAILNERMSHFNTKNFNGGVEVACQHNIGNFYSAQDQRLNKACFKSFF